MSFQKISGQLLRYAKLHQVNHQMILIRFFHERLLYRVGRSPYQKHLILKGGNLLYAIHGQTARPTIDIDFAGQQINNNRNKMLSIFEEIVQISGEDEVIFSPESVKAEEINEHNRYVGIRMKLQASLGNIKQNLQIDVGFGDIITPKPVVLQFPILIEGLKAPNLLSYSIETVIAEKLQAIFELAQLNSRMKDFYDIFTLLKTETIKNEILTQAIEQTFKNRKTDFNMESVIFTKDFKNDPTRIKMWQAFLKKINVDEISFSNVMDTIYNLLKNLNSADT